MNARSNHLHAGQRAELQHMLSSRPYPCVQAAPRPYPCPTKG